jgi:hypothetical protein
LLIIFRFTGSVNCEKPAKGIPAVGMQQQMGQQMGGALGQGSGGSHSNEDDEEDDADDS